MQCQWNVVPGRLGAPDYRIHLVDPRACVLPCDEDAKLMLEYEQEYVWCIDPDGPLIYKCGEVLSIQTDILD